MGRGLLAPGAAGEPLSLFVSVVDSCHQTWSSGQGYEDQVS